MSGKGKNPASVGSTITSRSAKFKEIYETYFLKLASYAFLITNSKEMAKDVVSEVFLSLWKSETDLSEIRELKSYLFTSVKNQAIRAVSRDPKIFDDFNTQLELKSVEYLNPEDLMIGNELAAKIREIVDAMPPQCQLVFKMVKEEGLKYHEVAERLDISTSMVKQHMMLALKNLRSGLEGHFSDAKVVKFISSLG
ncbi:MAG: RNA polymerase sigma-70 factor [Cyclobacteriaceae bacterium]|nr:RNA polymerase sigma-70 factor [Cyclobacteriaceae bacterium SS2]